MFLLVKSTFCVDLEILQQIGSNDAPDNSVVTPFFKIVNNGSESVNLDLCAEVEYLTGYSVRQFVVSVNVLARACDAIFKNRSVLCDSVGLIRKKLLIAVAGYKPGVSNGPWRQCWKQIGICQ